MGGTQRIGFFRQGSYSLVEVDDAFLIHPLINRTLKAVRSLVQKLPSLTEIHINATPGGRVHLLLFSELSTLPSLEPFYNDLKKAVPEVIGITGFTNKKKAFVIGSNRLSLELDGLTYAATEGNFYQVNW
jgi:tRNA/tmRNA/rRNA uracil-C5-methylase (TrmA/RlmC/RlmD family)